MKKINYFLFIFLLFFACDNVLELGDNTFYYKELFKENLDYMNMPRPTDSYNYPIYPGMTEWANFATGQQMVDACQIPKNTLSKMSTQAIIQAIWEYPLLHEIFHRYQYQSDLVSLFSTNNAYVELTQRKDAGSALFERLTLVDPLTPAPRLESQLLELLISQTVFLSQLKNDEKRKIVEIAFYSDDIRQNASMSLDHNIIAWLLIGRTMISTVYSPFVEVVNKSEQFKLFLNGNDGYTYMEQIIGDIPQEITNYGKIFLDNK